MGNLQIYLVPLTFTVLGGLGCTLCLLLLGRVLMPPFDVRGFLGIALFASLSVYMLKRGLELWKEYKTFY